jgi:hypothetical protein
MTDFVRVLTYLSLSVQAPNMLLQNNVPSSKRPSFTSHDLLLGLRDVLLVSSFWIDWRVEDGATRLEATGRKNDVRHKKTKETIFKWSWCGAALRCEGVVWWWCYDGGLGEERAASGLVLGEWRRTKQEGMQAIEGDREIPALRTEQNNFKIRRCSKKLRSEFSLFKQLTRRRSRKKIIVSVLPFPSNASI